jgi:1-acyl-sn-glycerol-3-phosphate acyltransferase
MNRIALSIYDYFKKRPWVAVATCVMLTIAFVASILTLHYKEDISDFLPLDEENQTALSVYQDISGAHKIYAIISTKDTTNVNQQELVDGVELFVANVEQADSAHYVADVVKEIDMERMLSVADIVYENIPYFLTDEDYARIDSLLSAPGYVDRQVNDDKEMLLFPSSNLLTANIARDPLNLFTPIMGRLSGSGATIKYETYDGYILSPDAKKAIVILESAFGAHESENNAKLVSLLDAATASTEKADSNLDIHIIGGPVIAVGNANQIKSDSIMAICIAGILILALLIYVFRKVRNILLIVVSVGWGWLMAMGVIALFYSSVSIIVIGIASVILGIAVNYPLHLIDHLKESDNPRAALKEIISPLVVGNITTVGAFLCLVPLNAPALHDLGLFSSLLLIGTILFVLIYLPHAVKTRRNSTDKVYEPKLITKLAGITIENNKHLVGAILLLTIVFGYFSLDTEFDSDMRNINFMTAEQRSDMAYFQSLVSNKANTESIYVVSNGKTWDDALKQNEIIATAVDSLVRCGAATRHNNVSSFLISKAEQERRLKRWNEFISKHHDAITTELRQSAVAHGFSENAFAAFDDIISAEYEPHEFEHFAELVSQVFIGNVSEDKEAGRKSVVQTIEVDSKSVDTIKDKLSSQPDFDGLCFDVRSMNSSIANTLSNDFNYIGFACGFIVFVFLWISLGSIELAIVSFLPMAVSWIWILGIMAILGIKFNIVNVILATFIFGQGDDYTIFMTEGLSYEYAYRKRLLASYKNSIVVSALIMFIGIGTLIFAKHPALRSLGEVTIVGMLSVVMMAYLFPPLIFNWLVRKDGKVRNRPITLKKILCTGYCATVFLTQLSVAYVMGFFMFVVTKPTACKKLFLHKFCCSVFRWDVKRMPGLKFRYDNSINEDFDSPAVIISNHQSMLDSFYLMFLHPKIIMVANDHVSTNRVTGLMFRWLDFITIGQGAESMLDKLKPFVAEGYSIAIFPEGERPRRASNNVKRFHKGAFQFAEELGIDILPVYLHGIVQAMPKGSALCHGGEIVIKIGQRISPQELNGLGETTKERAQAVKKQFQREFTKICNEQSTIARLKDTVYDRYRYKGSEIERKARRALRTLSAMHAQLESLRNGKDIVVTEQGGQGESALLLALMYPEVTIHYKSDTAEAVEILEGCMANFVTNIKITNDITEPDAAMNTLNIVIQ